MNVNLYEVEKLIKLRAQEAQRASSCARYRTRTNEKATWFTNFTEKLANRPFAATTSTVQPCCNCC